MSHQPPKIARYPRTGPPPENAAAPLNPELAQPHPLASSPFYFFMNEKRSPQPMQIPLRPLAAAAPSHPTASMVLGGAARGRAPSGAAANEKARASEGRLPIGRRGG